MVPTLYPAACNSDTLFFLWEGSTSANISLFLIPTCKNNNSNKNMIIIISVRSSNKFWETNLAENGRLRPNMRPLNSLYI